MNSIWAGQIHLLKCTFFEISHEKVSYPVPPKYRTPHSMQSFIPMCTYAMQLEIVDPLAFSLPLSSLSLYIYLFLTRQKMNLDDRKKNVSQNVIVFWLQRVSCLASLFFPSGKNDVVPADHMLLLFVCMVWFLTYHENYLMYLYIYVNIIAIFLLPEE